MALALLLVPALGCAQATDPDKPTTLTVIATTDFHGALLPEVMPTADGQRVEAGGAGLLAAYIKAIRARASGPTILIDAGDLFQGTLESNLPEGAPVVKFYNYLHVAAAAVGNHEFDYGPVGEHPIPLSPEDDPQGALKARVHEARFPFLAVNMVDDAGNTPPWIHRSFIYKRPGLRVGIIGAATPQTPDTTVRANLRGLHFLDPLPLIESEARALREQGHADVVILTMHDGGACKNNSLATQDDLSSCDDGAIFKLLKALPAGLIDVAVAGHTHQGIAKRVNGTAVIEAYSSGKQVGWADVTIGKPGSARVVGFQPVCGSTVPTSRGPSCFPSDVRGYRGALQPATFLGQTIVPDADALAVIAPFVERVRAIKETPLGVSLTDRFTRSYNGESALGNLMADVIRMAVNGADVGVTNGGGLRADIEAGPLTYGSVFSVLPFDNRIATMVVDGGVLRRMVELGHAGPQGGLSWSLVNYTAENCKVTGIQVDNEPIEDVKLYHVVTNDYLAGGGSGFDKLGIDPTKVHILWDGPYILRDVAVARIKDWNRDLHSSMFYDPANPRQKITGTCKSQ